MADNGYRRQIKAGYFYPGRPDTVVSGDLMLAKQIVKNQPKTLNGKPGRLITTRKINLDGTASVETSFVVAEDGSSNLNTAPLKVDTSKADSVVMNPTVGTGKTSTVTQMMHNTDADWKAVDAAVSKKETEVEDAVVGEYTEKEMATKGTMANSATATDSKLNQTTAERVESTTPGQSTSPKKDKLKKALSEDKKAEAIKKDIYPTIATGDIPGPPKIEYTSRVADYYRDGKEDVEGNLEQYSRLLDPFESTDTASIRVFGKKKGQKEPTDLIPAYTKFILESVQESHTERSQIVETFGDFYVFMFGERPPVYNFSGSLINAKSASWLTDFMFMYETYLRGSRCVASNAVAIVTYGGRQVEGLILNTANQTMAVTEAGVPFQFSLVVFERRFYNFSPDMGYYKTNNDLMLQDENFIKMLNKVAGIEGKDTSKPDLSKAIDGVSKTMQGGPASSLMPSMPTAIA